MKIKSEEIKNDLPELHNEFPFGLSKNHKASNENRVTPKYSIKYLQISIIKKKKINLSHKHTHRNYKQKRVREGERKYIRSVLEGSNGGEDVDGNAENGSERGYDAKALADYQKGVPSRSKHRVVGVGVARR